MTTLGLLDFTDIEKEVMMYIGRNSGKLCTIHSIFNDIIEDRNIINPEIRNDLKVKLHIVMSQLDSKQSNVSVVKRGESYLVGFNANNSSSTKTEEPVVETNISNPVDTSQLARSMFEYIVDNNIEYKINTNWSDDNLLAIGLRLGDYERIKKLQTKYSVSFFDIDTNGKTIMDTYPTLFVHQQCLHELKQQLDSYKHRENEYLTNIVRINNDMIGLENQIADIRRSNTQSNWYNLYLTIILFVMFLWVGL